MAYVDGFEYDVFISYAHLDNQIGWVTEFNRFLEVRLAELLGKIPGIWFDETEISGMDYFEEHIVSRLNSSALFISVISPPYLNSKWCLREYETFISSAQNHARIGEKTRVCKVVKTPVPLDEHPVEIRDVLGYRFFEEDRKGHAREFVAEKKQDSGYFKVLNDLAYDIRQLLNSMKSGQMDGRQNKRVYLAETASDLSDERDQIRRELLQRGIEVLPGRQLPTHGVRFIDEVQACLKTCELSIHIIGEEHSFIPAGETRSSVELQLEVASTIPGLQQNRLTWLPAHINPNTIKDERQKQFVDNIRNNPGGAELLEVSIEEVKTAIFDLLADKKSKVATKTAAGKPYVYLLYHAVDVGQVEPIYKHLFDKEKFDVVRPLLTGQTQERREDHEETLRNCDVVLIFHGEAQEVWVRKNERDLRKISGQGRDRSFDVSAMYLGNPETDYKLEFESNFLDLVIRHFEPFDPSSLAGFVESVRTETIRV